MKKMNVRSERAGTRLNRSQLGDSTHWPPTASLLEKGRRKHLKSGGPSPKMGTLSRPFWASKGHFCIVC